MGKIKALMETMLGKARGVASLDENSNVPFDQLGNVSRPNLLNNWYLADPIDQRGGYVVPPETAYYSDTVLTTQVGTLSGYANVTNVDGVYGTVNVSGTVYYIDWTNAVRGYCGGFKVTIDRWKSSSVRGVIFVEDGALKIESTAESTNYAYLLQTVENGSEYFGKTLTFSVLDADGELHTLTSVLVDEDYTDKATSFGRLRVGTSDDNWGELYVVIGVEKGGNSKSFIAAKLELGDTQTLAHQDENGNWVLNDPPPDKATELLKCQRYFYRLKSHNKNKYGVLAQGWIQSATQARSLVQFPCTMRGAPSITASGAIQVLSGGADVLVKNILTSSQSFNGDSTVIMAEFDQWGAVTYLDFAFIGAKNDTTAYIDFDAEL